MLGRTCNRIFETTTAFLVAYYEVLRTHHNPLESMRRQFVQLQCTHCKTQKACYITRTRIVDRGETVRSFCRGCWVYRDLLCLRAFAAALDVCDKR